MLKPYFALPRAVHVLCLGTFVNRAGTFLVPFLTLYLTSSLGLGSAFATQAMGLYGFGGIVAALTGGALADRIGRRTVMMISLLGAASLLAFFGRLTSPPAILAAVLAFSFLGEMYRPAASAISASVIAVGRANIRECFPMSRGIADGARTRPPMSAWIARPG